MKGSRIELGDVTPHNIKQLKRLNQVIFPVSYNDKFYKDVLEVGELAKLAYFNDIPVGAVCCRVDHSQNQKRLYIMTLGCLAPYRRLGIGTKMLNHVLNICEKDGTFDNIYLHVQINNESAIDFYQRRAFAARVRRLAESFRRPNRGPASEENADVTASAETEL
uniref:N-alpha-acetyltransferase 50 n=1 Tax=Takifugu rubripes TaxID=31033 RepID=A0A3B5K2Z9_TAKRU